MDNLKKENLKKAAIVYFEQKAPNAELLDVHKYMIDKAVDFTYRANLHDSDTELKAVVDLLLLNIDKFYEEILERITEEMPTNKEGTITLTIEDHTFLIPSYESFAILGDKGEAVTDL